jgi:prevent-host-death family protein
MKRLSSVEARKDFSSIVDRAFAGKRTVITRSGKDRAALVPISDFELLKGLKQENRKQIEKRLSSKEARSKRSRRRPDRIS